MIPKILIIVFNLIAITSTVFVGYTTDLYFKAYDVGQKLGAQLSEVKVEKVDDYYVSVKILLYIENKAALTFKLSYAHITLYLNGTKLGEGSTSFTIPIEVEPSKNSTVSITINNVLAAKIVNPPRLWFAQIMLYVLGIPFIEEGARFSRSSIFKE